MATTKLEEGKEQEKGDPVEVDILIKHPLHNIWTLWFFENDKKKGWKENLKEITSFSTVEDFWSIYNHIKAASELKTGCDYSLFKKGITPMWEDDANRNGGRWIISFERNHRRNDLDNFWLEILLSMIGEAFDEHSDEICGATVSVRPRLDKIGLWTGHADRSTETVAIGKKMRERLRLPQKVSLAYQVHKDTEAKSGSTTKITYSA